MSRAETVTKLPLATWAKIMGIHPLHFEQVNINGMNPHCQDVWFQHEWQTADHISREELARAIAEAETNIENVLGFRLAPSWEVDEWRESSRSARSELITVSGGDIRGYRPTVRANWGYFISGGIQSKELIEANSPIVYSDTNSDNYFETATVSVATVAVDPNEIAIYYPGKEGDDAWEIKPTQVEIVAGVATIRFRRELVVTEALLEAFDVEEDGAADGLDDNDFLEEVDIYRRYNDPQTQVSMLWEPLAGGYCASCHGEGCTNCAYSAQTGCLIIRGDPRQSLVGYAPADWDVDEQTFGFTSWNLGRQPDILRLYYYAGLRDKRQRYTSRLSPEWERTIAHYAASLLDRPPCECGADVWHKWRQDLTLDSGDEEGKPFYRTPSGVLDNPLGSMRGAVEAWRKIKDIRVGSAVRL